MLGHGPIGSAPLGGTDDNKQPVKPEAERPPTTTAGATATFSGVPFTGGNEAAFIAANQRRRINPAIYETPLGSPATLLATANVEDNRAELSAVLGDVTSDAAAPPPPPPTQELRPALFVNEDTFPSPTVEQSEAASATDTVDATVVRSVRTVRLRIEQDCDQLLLVASSLGQMARAEIARLASERPNDESSKARNAKQRELLEIFAEGFEQLASALAAFARNRNEPFLLGTAAAIVNAVAHEVEAWLAKNKAEAVDWGVKIPVIAAGVGLLGLVGADMTVATAVVGALVGGKPVIDAIRKGSE
jgi:hypothetical protein